MTEKYHLEDCRERIEELKIQIDKNTIPNNEWVTFPSLKEAMKLIKYAYDCGYQQRIDDYDGLQDEGY